MHLTERGRELESQVLAALKEGPVANNELAARVGVSRRRLWDVLQGLLDQGVVRKKPDFTDLRRTLYVLQR